MGEFHVIVKCQKIGFLSMKKPFEIKSKLSSQAIAKNNGVEWLEWLTSDVNPHQQLPQDMKSLPFPKVLTFK